MNRSLKRLNEILNDEIDLYEELLLVLDDEKKAVIRARFEDVNQVVKKKDILLAKLARMDHRRVEILKNLEPEFSVSQESLTLSGIIVRVDEPHATRLSTCQWKLKNLVKDIQTKSRENRGLFEHSLEIVNSSINVLNHLTASNPVYCQNGRMGNHRSQGHVLANQI